MHSMTVACTLYITVNTNIIKTKKCNTLPHISNMLRVSGVSEKVYKNSRETIITVQNNVRSGWIQYTGEDKLRVCIFETRCSYVL